jgi:hypothetical protein
MHGAGHGCPFCIPLLWFIQNDSKQGIPLKSKSDYFHLADEAGVPPNWVFATSHVSPHKLLIIFKS